jgi:hypothetical protein
MDTTTDPRMTGRYTAAWNVDYWGTPDKQNGALVQWGTGRLTNDGGSWDGRAAGVYSSDEGDTIVWWWTGTGGYAGLAAFELVTGTQPWKVQGQIFPGTPPDPASVAPPTTTATFPPSHLKTPPPVPTAAVYGPTSVFSGTEQCDVSKMMGNMTDAGDGLTQWRDGTVLCGDTVNDARMSGAYSATWNIDHWPDDALVQWGNARFANSGGAWTGLGSGVYSPDRGDIIVWWWTGTEGYAGLAAFEAVTGSGTWAIEGQIFPGSPPQP